MPTLEHYRKAYYDYSRKLSDVSRNLAFAGIAVIWIFRVEAVSTSKLPNHLLWPITFLVASLGLDLLHYISSTTAWGFFQWFKEKKLGPNDKTEFDAPRILNWLPLLFFAGKVVAVVIGYIFLLSYLGQILIPSSGI